MADKTDVNAIKTLAPFRFEGEIAKIKITIPLTKLVTQEVYRSHIFKVLNIGNDTDTLNLTNDKLVIFFGPEVEGRYQ